MAYTTYKRVGHTERERYVEHLANMVATGFLKDEEFSERRDKALEAITSEDLIRLVSDLPAVPGKKQVDVIYQQSGGWRFSPWRWGLALTLGTGMIFFISPILAIVYHGLGHSPLGGGLAFMLAWAGAAVALTFGIAWAPGKTVTEDAE
jgi:hypothetical protein